LPRLEFTAGEVLQAADMNTISDQTVMVFAGTAARGSAIPSPSEGMVTYLKDEDKLFQYVTDWEAVSQPGILQVVQTVKTDTFTTTSNTFADLTGFSATITPSSASSKIMVFANITTGSQVNAAVNYRLLRDSTDIFIGDTADSRTRVSKEFYAPGFGTGTETIQFLDSPATTSATTYKVQIRSSESGQIVAVNRSITDSDSAAFARSASSITLMEVAG
jgi:hypothetical protein